MTLLEQTTYSKLCLRSLGLRLNYLKLANLHMVLRLPPSIVVARVERVILLRYQVSMC